MVNTNWVNKQTAKHYEKDLELYSKTFPSSRYLADFNNPHKLNANHLCQRMLLELLSSGKVTVKDIEANRIVKATKEKVVDEETKAKAISTLLKIDIDNTKYNVLKKLVFA